MHTRTEFTGGCKVRYVPHFSGDLVAHRCLHTVMDKDVSLNPRREPGRQGESGVGAGDYTARQADVAAPPLQIPSCMTASVADAFSLW